MSIITPIIQSTNSNIVQSVFGGLLPNISVLRIGDSLQSQMEDLYSAAGQVSFADSYPNSTQNNRAISGSTLTEDAAIAGGQATQHWVASDTVSAGDKYTQMLAGVPDTNAITHILIDIGNNDGFYVPSTVSEATFKSSLIGLYNLLKSDFPNAEIIQNFLGRHRNASVTGFREIRRAQLEAVNETSDILKGIDIVDLDLFDNVHLTQAGYEEKGRREAILIQNRYNPVTLNSVTVFNNLIEFNFSGSLTIPNQGDGQFGVEQGGDEKSGIYTLPSVNKVVYTLDNNEGFRIDDDAFIFTNYDRHPDLSQTDPDVFEGSNLLPPQTNIVVPTGNSAILSNSNVVEYWHAKYSKKTFGTGSEVTAIEGLKGAGFTSISTDHASYNPNLYGGAGGLEVVGATEAITLSPVNSFTASASHTLFFVLDLVSSGTNNGIMNFANSSDVANSNARAFLNTLPVDLNYGRNEANGFEVMLNNFGANQLVFAMRYNNAGSLEFWGNNTAVSGSFDPADVFSTLEKLQLFSRNGQTESVQGFSYGAFVGAWGSALTDEEVAHIIIELGKEFNISITDDGNYLSSYNAQGYGVSQPTFEADFNNNVLTSWRAEDAGVADGASVTSITGEGETHNSTGTGDPTYVASGLNGRGTLKNETGVAMTISGLDLSAGMTFGFVIVPDADTGTVFTIGELFQARLRTNASANIFYDDNEARAEVTISTLNQAQIIVGNLVSDTDFEFFVNGNQVFVGLDPESLPNLLDQTQITLFNRSDSATEGSANTHIASFFITEGNAVKEEVGHWIEREAKYYGLDLPFDFDPNNFSANYTE